MAVQYQQEQPAQAPGILGAISSHPALALALVGVVGVLVVSSVMKQRAQLTSGSPTDHSGLDNGNIVYVPTQTSFTTINKGNTTTTNNNPPPPPPPVHVPVPPTPGPKTQVAYVRARYSNPLVRKWDEGHPQGVPIRSGPSGSASIAKYAAYGSQVTLTGAGVSGSGNTGTTSGSFAWLPVSGGFISAFDVTGVQSVDPAGHAKGGGDPHAIMRAPMPSPAPYTGGRSLIWDQQYKMQGHETLNHVAHTLTRKLRAAGMPGSMSVTWADLLAHNGSILSQPGGDHVSRNAYGATITVPRWG